MRTRMERRTQWEPNTTALEEPPTDPQKGPSRTGSRNLSGREPESAGPERAPGTLTFVPLPESSPYRALQKLRKQRPVPPNAGSLEVTSSVSDADPRRPGQVLGHGQVVASAPSGPVAKLEGSGPAFTGGVTARRRLGAYGSARAGEVVATLQTPDGSASVAATLYGPSAKAELGLEGKTPSGQPTRGLHGYVGASAVGGGRTLTLGPVQVSSDAKVGVGLGGAVSFVERDDGRVVGFYASVSVGPFRLGLQLGERRKEEAPPQLDVPSSEPPTLAECLREGPAGDPRCPVVVIRGH